jgi:hypothetical protein
VAWDGLGNTADSDDFSESFPTNIRQGEIDATANLEDALFDAVISNTAAMLVSVTGDPGGVAVFSHHIDGVTHGAVWALQTDVDSSGHIEDLDALEVWGPDFIDDSNRISLLGDPFGVAIWDCVLPAVPGGCTPTPGATTAAIAAAIAALDPAYLPLLDLIDEIDLDALMYSEGSPIDDLDDRILFSLRPVEIADPAGGPPFVILDGGEVFVWTIGAPAAAFLVHGGDIWDTAHCVLCEFGDENVDALEAVAFQKDIPLPVPGTLALLGIVVLSLGRRIRRMV